MGCSASRPNTHFTTPSNEEQQQPSPSSSPSSSSSPYLTKPHYPCRAVSLPTPLVHHPPVKKGDTHHLVSLTSTTYGSLILINNNNPPDHDHVDGDSSPCSSSPDSVINTWELMDGLDDDEENYVLDVDSSRKASSFLVNCDDKSMKKLLDSYEIVEEVSISKPLWKHLSEESLLSKMDPNVASSYRRALSSRHLGCNNQKRLPLEKSLVSSPCPSPSPSSVLCRPPEKRVQLPGTEDKIVLYSTSLRGIRKTYEDCCAVRMIFKGFRVAIDERDISMDAVYRKELQSALELTVVSLPQVFIRGIYVGGVDEVKQLHEVGELGKLLEGFPVRDPSFVCKNCGDARFLPCSNCNGSRKVFGEEDGILRRCVKCNENGLIRCWAC